MRLPSYAAMITFTNLAISLAMVVVIAGRLQLCRNSQSLAD